MLVLDFCTGLATLVSNATVGVQLPPRDDVFAVVPICTELAEFFLRLVDVRSSFCKRVIAVSVAAAAELVEFARAATGAAPLP